MKKPIFLWIMLLSLSFIGCSDDKEEEKIYNPEDFEMYHMAVAMGLEWSSEDDGKFSMHKSLGDFYIQYTFFKVDYFPDKGVRKLRQELTIRTVIDGSKYRYYYTEECKKTADGFEIPLVKYTDVGDLGWLEGYFNSWDDFWFHCGDPEIELTPDDI